MPSFRNVLAFTLTLLASVAFFCDVLLRTELPNVGLWLYVPAMLLTVLPPMWSVASRTAVFCTALIVFGFVLGYDPAHAVPETLGRGVIVYAIWVTAAYCRKARRIDRHFMMRVKRLERMIDESPALHWIFEPGSGRVHFNATWLRFTGRTPEEERGSGWMDNVHAEDIQNCRIILNTSCAARRPFHMEYRLGHADGGFRWLLEQGTPCFERGKLVAYVGVCVEISELKQNEESLKRAIRHAEDAHAETRALNDSISRSIARADSIASEVEIVNRAQETPTRVRPARKPDPVAVDTPVAPPAVANDIAPSLLDAPEAPQAEEDFETPAIADDPFEDLLDGLVSQSLADSHIDIEAPLDDTEADRTDPQPAANGERLDVKVLLAESDPEDRRVLEGLLTSLGTELDSTDSGRRGVELAWSAERQGEPYHVVFMGCDDRGLDCDEAIRTLRDGGYTMPIVAVLKDDDPSLEDACRSAGCTDLVRKPYASATLASVLRTHMAQVFHGG